MITAAYCQMMAKYNAWQNAGLRAEVAKLSVDQVTAPRGVFFGSLMGTLNHLLWADQIWLARFLQEEGPGLSIPESVNMHNSFEAWEADRMRTDPRISGWAEQVTDAALGADLTWHSGAAGREVTKPMALCVTHFFNHQTHHRGQIHAMLTQSELTPQDTDLFLLPE
ncbi:MAG: DinB family protein [Pseudomonadota bacterium]